MVVEPIDIESGRVLVRVGMTVLERVLMRWHMATITFSLSSFLMLLMVILSKLIEPLKASNIWTSFADLMSQFSSLIYLMLFIINDRFFERDPDLYGDLLRILWL